MRLLFFLILYFFLSQCYNSHSVYWCGDHECVNKKEREVYFQKTMIVEVKKIKKGEKKDTSNLEIIKKNFIKEEKEKAKNIKKLEKQAAKERKNKIKDEKEQKKLELMQEKERQKALKKREKEIKKIEKANKKKIVKKYNKKSNKNDAKQIKTFVAENNKVNTGFGDLVEKILNRNSSKSYPDINEMPD